MLNRTTSRISFAPAEEVVLFSVDSNQDFQEYPSIEDLQEALASLRVRDPMAQIQGIRTIASAPYIFDESPLSDRIYEEFKSIFLSHSSVSTVHTACEVLSQAVRSINPVVCIRYLAVVIEGIGSRVSYAYEYDSFLDPLCTIVFLLLSLGESFVTQICTHFDHVYTMSGSMANLGLIIARFFDRVHRICNGYQHDLAAHGAATADATSGASDVRTARHVLLLESVLEYAVSWLRTANTLPFVSNGIVGFYTEPSVAERTVASLKASGCRTSVQAVVETLFCPEVVDFVGHDTFTYDLISLDPDTAAKALLSSVYLTRLTVRILFRKRIAFSQRYRLLTIAALSTVGAPAPALLASMHSSNMQLLLQFIVDSSAQPSSGTRASPRFSKTSRLFLPGSTDGVPVIDVQQRRPVPLFMKHELADRVRASTDSAGSVECENFAATFPSGACRPPAPRDDDSDSKPGTAELTPIELLAFDSFVSMLNKMPDLPYASIVVETFEKKYASHSGNLPHILCRVLSCTPFVPHLSHGFANRVFNTVLGATVALLSKGTLHHANTLLEAALNIKFTFALYRREPVTANTRLYDILRDVISERACKGTIDRATALCLTLLPTFLTSGVEVQLFIMAPSFEALPLDFGNPRAEYPLGESETYPLAMRRYLGFSGAALDCWLSTADAGGFALAKFLSSVSPKK